jgi:hypothetical protein
LLVDGTFFIFFSLPISGNFHSYLTKNNINSILEVMLQ